MPQQYRCAVCVMAEDELWRINDSSQFFFLPVFVFIPPISTLRNILPSPTRLEAVLVPLHRPHELPVLNGNFQRAWEV